MKTLVFGGISILGKICVGVWTTLAVLIIALMLFRLWIKING